MNLEEFYDYKNQLMSDILTQKEIVELLEGNWTEGGDKSLAYTQVFPFEYIPETVQEGKTFICFDVDIQRDLNKTYLLPTIYVWVFAHRSKLRLPEGGVRTDKICSKICETINGSRYYGLGELDLHSVKRFAPMTDFQGKVMTFQAVDFNRLHTPKSTPSNRKLANGHN